MGFFENINDYSALDKISSVHSSFFAFGLRRRTNHAIRGKPISMIIYWSIHPLLVDHLDEFHDHDMVSSAPLDFDT